MTSVEKKDLLKIGGEVEVDKLKLRQAEQLKIATTIESNNKLKQEELKALALIEGKKIEAQNVLDLERQQAKTEQNAAKSLAQRTRLTKLQDGTSDRVQAGFKKLEEVIANGSPGDQWRAAGELKRDIKFYMTTQAQSLKNLNLPGISDSMLKDMTAPLTLAIDKAEEGAFMNELIAHKKHFMTGASGTPNSTAWTEMADIYSQGDSFWDGLAKVLHLRDSQGMAIDRNFADFMSIENGYLQVYNSSEDRHSYLNPSKDGSWGFGGNESKDRPGMPLQMGDPEPLANYPMWFQRGIKERIAKSIATYDKDYKELGDTQAPTQAPTIQPGKGTRYSRRNTQRVTPPPMTTEQEQSIKNMRGMKKQLDIRFPNRNKR
jgi:hypothetical protein